MASSSTTTTTEPEPYHGPPRIPNVLLAGAQKSGTTAISKYLFRLQNGRLVCGAQPPPDLPWMAKEPHFFDHDHLFSQGLLHYQDLYQHCPSGTILFDGTPDTMPEPDRVHQIYQEAGTLDRVKIIFVLREPVSREISWYSHMVRAHVNHVPLDYYQEIVAEDGTSTLSFEQHIQTNVIPSIQNGTDYGLYVIFLRDWFDLFGRHNVLVLSYDNFREHPHKELQAIHQFLHLPPYVPGTEAPHVNSQHVPIDPIPCSVQKRLADYYDDLNQQLYDLLEEQPGPDHRSFREFAFECRA